MVFLLSSDCDGSPYHMDMMDYLVDLQRDGLIKSISGANFPPSFVRSIHNAGFRFDVVQTNVNLLDPNLYDTKSQLLCSDLDIPMTLSNPLAGGLLTSKWQGLRYPPLSQEMAPGQHKHMTEMLRKWGNNRQIQSEDFNEFSSWEKYQKELLPVLEHIALYHGVSMAAVALRWSLQLDHVGSTVVRCNMMREMDDRPRSLSTRLKQLRDVFRFELSKEDMDRLWDVSGVDKSVDRNGEDDEEDELRSMMKNRSLWL